MPGETIPQDYQNFIQISVRGDKGAFKKLMDDLKSSEKNLSKQSIVDLLFSQDNIFNDLYKFSDEFINELLAWYKQGEIKVTSKKLEISLKVLQACRDASQSNNTVFSIDESELAVMERKDQARLFCFRGTIFYNRKDHVSALADYANAARLDPSCNHYPGNRGVLYHSMRNYDDAERELNHAIILNPQCVSYYVYLASVYFEKKDYPRAIITYTKVIELEPHKATNYENRARVYRWVENYTAAMDDYISAARCLENQLNGNPPPPAFSQASIRVRIDEIVKKINLCHAMVIKKSMREIILQQNLFMQQLSSFRNEVKLDGNLKRLQTTQNDSHTNVTVTPPSNNSSLNSGPEATQAAQRTITNTDSTQEKHRVWQCKIM